MTENMKRFLEEASKDKDFIEKVKATSDVETLLDLAKEKGFALTKEDLEAQPEALADEELDAVAGGVSGCVCALGGGGKAAVNTNNIGDTYDNKTCACVLGGAGQYLMTDRRSATELGTRCYCAVAGSGIEY